MSEQKHVHTLIFICLVVFFDALAVGLILPVMPDLIMELSEAPLGQAAAIGGYLTFTFAAMQFVAAPVLGGLSDRYGRRPVLLLALAGFSVDYFVMAAAPSLAFLFVARLISGILGATYPVANACAVDISTPENRAKNFGLLGGAIGLGFVFGPAFGGLLGEYGYRIPFIVAGLLSAGTCVYGYFALPETLPAESKRKFELRRANPFGSLLSISRFPIVLWVFAGIFFVQLAAQSYVSIWSYFTIELFDWSPQAIGISAAVYGIVLAGVQGGVTGPAVARFGEIRTAIFSLLLAVIVYTGMGLATQPLQVYFWIVIGGLSAMALPSMQALMSQRVPADAQGELQGAIASSYSLTAIIGPIMMTQLFASYTDELGLYLPGAPFLTGTVLICVALCAIGYGVRRLLADSPPERLKGGLG